MSLAQSMLAEFEAQAPITRKFLERLPEEHLGWKPHPKSMSAGQLALHIAQIPGGIARLAESNPAVAPNFQAPQPESRQQILDAFDRSAAAVAATLPAFDDARMQEIWRLMLGDHEVFAIPRGQFLRDVMLNHWYQHRGQFGVYLRLLDIAVPSSFGPSADETPI